MKKFLSIILKKIINFIIYYDVGRKELVSKVIGIVWNKNNMIILVE